MSILGWFHQNILQNTNFMTWLVWETILWYSDCSYVLQCCDLIGARFMPKCSYLIRASNITFNTLSEFFFLIKNITQKSFNWMHTTILTVQVCVLNRHLHNLAALKNNCSKLFHILFKNSMEQIKAENILNVLI